MKYLNESLICVCNWGIRLLDMMRTRLCQQKLRPIWFLCPRTDALDLNSAYLMDEALSNKSVCNIAITGAYGSGKSTFLESYFANRPGEARRVLWISMLDFRKCDVIEGQGSAFRRDIEERIIQQMLCSVDRNAVPHSRFARAVIRAWIDEVGLCVLLAAWILVFVIYKNRSGVPGLITTLPLEWRGIALMGLVVAGSVIVYITVANIYRIICRRFSSATIRLGSGEINFATTEGSAFAENLNEIVYFFDRTRYSTVIFEDIDRFCDTRIFTELRDLNSRLNHSGVLKRRIKFIYAVRDDLFADATHRTKFFDFMVPVLSYATAFNARDILARQLCEGYGVASLSVPLSKAVKQLAEFIPDMRTLNNVCNEFFYYLRSLSVKTQEEVKIFGLVIAKNLMPGEFAKMRNGRGVLAALLDLKMTIQEEESAQHEKTLKILRAELESLKVQDPRIQPKVARLSRDEMQQLRKREKELRLSIQDLDRTVTKIKATQLIAYIHKDRITQRNIAMLFEKVSGTLDEAECKRCARLLYKLLDAGYLTEDFESLISREQSGYLDPADRDFERDVMLYKETRNWKRAIVSPQDVVDDLDTRYFVHPQILNFEILEFLLKNDKAYRDKLQLLVGQLQAMGDSAFVFIDNFMKVKTSRRVHNKLFFMIARAWGRYVEDLVAVSDRMDINKQLRAYIHMANYVRTELDVLSPAVWTYLDSLRDASVLLDGKADGLRNLCAAIEHFGFAMKGCGDSNLRRLGLWQSVEKVRSKKIVNRGKSLMLANKCGPRW